MLLFKIFCVYRTFGLIIYFLIIYNKFWGAHNTKAISSTCVAGALFILLVRTEPFPNKKQHP